jgi:tetratricopeptide (TPR) repeat protein
LKIALFATFRLQFIEDKDIILKLEKIKTNSDVLNNRIKKTIKIINQEIKLKDIEEAQNMIDKAYLNFENKKYSESLKQVSLALKLDPTNPDAYWIMANVELLKDKTSPTIVEQLKKAILYGFIEQSSALFSLGTVLLNQKKTEEAIGYLKNAALIQPDPVIYYQLGVAYSYINKKTEAINATQNAVKLDPEYALAHYNLSLLYDSIGDKEKASAHLKKYNSLKTNAKK